jgi:hypothetical protein
VLGPFSTRAERPECMMLGVHTLGCAQYHLRSPATPAQPCSTKKHTCFLFYACGVGKIAHIDNFSHASSPPPPTRAHHAAGSNMTLNPARIMFLVAAFALKADAVCRIPSNVLDVRCAAGCIAVSCGSRCQGAYELVCDNRARATRSAGGAPATLRCATPPARSTPCLL